jgi:hypothetical protein
MSAMNLEFEHTEKKIAPLGLCRVMTIGDRRLGAELIERAVMLLGADAHTTKEVAGSLTRVLMEDHVGRAERLVLYPYGVSFEEFKTRGAAIFQPAVYKEIADRLWGFGVNPVEFLVCGVDEAAHIYRVHYHGVNGGDWLELCDGNGFQAGGAGAVQATTVLAMAGQSRDDSVSQTIYNVYVAKRSAESAPGVGMATDMVVMTSSGARELTTDGLVRLSALYEKKRAAVQPTEAELAGLELSGGCV